MMENKDCKPWERPWSIDEISKNSENWNLAGDAGLLRHLQHFSQVLLERTHSSEVALNLLLDGMKATAVDISNVTNTFLMLTNTQFVENRVYEDDDDDDGEKVNIPEALPQVKPKEEQAAENVASVKKALTLGMSVLDTMFDAVEVPASDSEDEDYLESVGHVVLQPRNTYFLQPLPCMIGSKDFVNDDTVGLMELLSDNDENMEHNIVSSSSSGTSSDVEHEVTEPDGSRDPHSSLSSESENSDPESERSVPLGKKNYFEPNSRFIEIPEECASDGAMFGGESPPEAENVSGFSKPLASVDFASELAAKLGGIPGDKTSLTGNDHSQSQDNFFGDGDHEDSLFGHDVKESKEGGLFDDFDQMEKPEGVLWNTSISNQSNTDAVIAAQEPSSNTTTSHIQPETSFPEKKRKKPVGGISVLGMVNKSPVKNSPYVCSPPSTSSESDLNEDIKPETVPSITNISGEIRDGISKLPVTIEQKTSSLDEPFHTEAFTSHSLFDPDEEDALFLPSSTSKQQKTCLETSQQKLLASTNQDKSQKRESVRSKSTVSSRSSKPSPAIKSSSAHDLECCDSDDDKNLFSSTCSSISSRSSKSQTNNDILAKTDKITQKKDSLQNPSMFSSNYLEEPTFDIFGSAVDKNNSWCPKIKKNDYSKENSPVSINEGNETIGKTSSHLFGFSDDVPDVFTSRSNNENIQSKENMFSSQDFNDTDDIFSAIKTSSEENLYLFSTQKLDDDFDIFSNLVSADVSNSNKNYVVDSPKSNVEPLCNHSIVEGEKKRQEENDHQEVLTQSSLLIDGTDIYSRSAKPDTNSNLPIDTEDKTDFQISTSDSKNAFINVSEIASNVISTYDSSKNKLTTHSTKSETVNTDQNKYLVKPQPPRLLSINKITDLICEGASCDNVLEQHENTHLLSKGFANSISKPLFLPSTSTNVHMSSSPPGSGSITKSEEMRPEIDQTSGNVSNGTSNFEASPGIPSSSSHMNINSLSGTQSSKSNFSETAVSFDSPVCTSSVLQSNVKERARIPAKRRPQSRKARKEALKASSLDCDEDGAIDTASIHDETFLKDAENKLFSGKILLGVVQEKYMNSFPALNLNNSFPESEIKITGENNAVNHNIVSVCCNDTKPFSPSTDEEDFFGVPSDLPFEFNNSRDTSNNNEVLFADAPILSPVVSSHEEINKKVLYNDLPPVIMPSSSVHNHLMGAASTILSNIEVNAGMTQDLNNSGSCQLPKDVASNDTNSETCHSAAKLSHKNRESDKISDKNVPSCDHHSSKYDLFVAVDNIFLPEDEYDIFQTVPKYKENGKTNSSDVSKNEHINFSSDDNCVTSINEKNKIHSIENCSQDTIYNKQQWFATDTNPNLNTFRNDKTLFKGELFQNSERDINDLFSSDVKIDETKHKDSIYAVAENSSVLPSKLKEKHDSSGLDCVGSSTQTSKSSSSSEDEIHSSSLKKSDSLTVHTTKSKKKDTIFFDHDDDDDISIFSSSFPVAAETTRASASSSRKTGLKSHGGAGENIPRHKSLSQMLKSGDEKFEDPLKVAK